MASKLEELTTFLSKNNNAQLAIVAAAASVATLVTVFSIQGVQRKRRVRKLKEELGDFSDGIENMNQKFEPMFSSYDRDPSVSELFQKEYPNRIVDKKSVINLQSDEKELFSEQLARNKVFFGEEGLEKIMNSFVIVVGAGGVGSWAVMMLLRSGVQRIRIIDFDQVTLSSLNRHAVASRSDVGTPKTVVLQQYIQNIVPHALIDARVELFNIENASELLSGNPDYVIDCIDNITTKLDLLKYCYDNNLRVISSMGSGMKSDPSRIQIADIGNTFEDPLSRSVRRQLKKMGIEQGIEVVYSTEKPGKVQLLPLSESQEESAEEFAVLPDFRVRIVPVLGTMPAIFGMTLATRVLTNLAGFDTEPLAIKGRHALYVRLNRDLLHREGKITGKIKSTCLSVEDCGYLLEEIWRGKSVISGATDKLTLIRWDVNMPLSLQNCVCMTKSEADKHEKIKVAPEIHYPKEVVDLIKSRFAEEMWQSRFR